MDNSKQLGQVFTPFWVVELMLDEINYNGEGILDATILEPSCGNGAFLIEIVKRLVATAKRQNRSDLEIKHLLENNVMGIELDQELQLECIRTLDNVARQFGILNVQWNIICDNFLNPRERERLTIS